MSTKSKSKGAAPGGKRKVAAPAAVKQEPSAEAAESAPAHGDAAASADGKLNRRQSKKAKTDASAASAQAAAASLALAESRPASAKKKAASKARKTAAAKLEKDEDERELEAFLFGSEEALFAAPEEAPKRAEGLRALPHKMAASEADATQLFQIDTAGAHAAVKQEEDSKDRKVKGEGEGKPAEAEEGPKAAWADEDDEASGGQLVDLSSAARLRKLKTGSDERFISRAEYSRRLRAVFHELNPAAKNWAKAEEASDADITTLLLQSASSTAGVVGGGSGRQPGGAGRGEPVPSTTLDLVRLKDANLADPSSSVVSSVKFHPQGQLLFTAGLDKMVRLFQVDGAANAKVAGVWLDDMPVHSAAWLPALDGSANAAEIIATGRRSHFYTIDVASNAVSKISSIRGRDERSLERMTVSPDGSLIAILGNDGFILLLSGKSKQLIGSVKLNGSVRSAHFSADSTLLYSVGSEGVVYIWHVGTRKCLAKHQDEGSINGTAIAVDQGRGMYAVGADSGVVNLYNSSQLSERLSSSASQAAAASSLQSSARLSAALARSAPLTPLKSVMNLTTPIDTLLFNHDSSLLLMSSRRKKDSLKLLHTASHTVFANWPTSSTPLHYVSAVDFSPNSGYMAIGNDRGRVLLYRLTHYTSA